MPVRLSLALCFRRQLSNPSANTETLGSEGSFSIPNTPLTATFEKLSQEVCSETSLLRRSVLRETQTDVYRWRIRKGCGCEITVMESSNNEILLY